MTICQKLITRCKESLGKLLKRFEGWVKMLTKPSSAPSLLGTSRDLVRTKSQLMAENAFLRHQIIVLSRQTNRPKLKRKDRLLMILLARIVTYWRDVLLIVQPDTLLRWHRQGFKLIWNHKSRSKKRKPRIPQEAIDLIGQMAVENRLWGAKHIRDELTKLGYTVHKRTVSKYMKRARKNDPPASSSQTWATFIKNYASEIWACDFMQTYDLFFRPIFVFFIIELGSRRVVHFNITRQPTDQWVAQQLKEATAYGEGPRFLIRDNDKKFGPKFTEVARNTQIDVLKTPIRAPKANAICERFIGSVRRECFDHIIVLSRRHVYQTIKEYVTYFNHERPHQGIGSRIPQPLDDGHSDIPSSGPVIATPILNGLHHTYRRAA